tara:strand:+ start:843 stop:2006 length:1164 start_codon:yes stop_codon:yes gene_type:complete
LAKRKVKNVYFTPEPDWKSYANTIDPEKQLKSFRDCEYFARTEIADKKKVELTRSWIKENSGWDETDIKSVLKNPDWAFGASATNFYIAHKIGYLPEEILEHINKRKIEWVESGNKILDEVKVKTAEANLKPVISIQQRMREQVESLLGEWEGKLDDFISGNVTLADFNPYLDMQVFDGGVVKPAHAKIIRDSVETNIAEAHEIIAWECEQIREGFSFMTPKFRKEYLKWFEKIQTSCDTLIETGKTTRKPRKKRSVSKEKMVTKLKFQVNESTLGIASIPVEDVVYANEVWVYNTKSRKIGVYKATNQDPKNMKREGAGLKVKGTTIIDFDIKTSVQKTLRKPADQMPVFKSSAKTKCQKYFEEIKAVSTNLSGRLNDTTIILKAF